MFLTQHSWNRIMLIMLPALESDFFQIRLTSLSSQIVELDWPAHLFSLVTEFNQLGCMGFENSL